MDRVLHIVCPHCDTINRLPQEKLAAALEPAARLVEWARAQLARAA